MKARDYLARLTACATTINPQSVPRVVEAWELHLPFTKWAPRPPTFVSPEKVDSDRFVSLLAGLGGSRTLTCISYSSLRERKNDDETCEEYATAILEGKMPEFSLGDFLFQWWANHEIPPVGGNELTAVVDGLTHYRVVARKFTRHFPNWSDLEEGINGLAGTEDYIADEVVQRAWAAATWFAVNNDDRASTCLELLRLCQQAIPIGICGGTWILLTA